MLDLTIPQLVWLGNGGRFPKRGRARSLTEAMDLLAKYAESQGVSCA